ncbi:hypothetical protein, partial [Acidiphilium sp.]|uniref:hypothetical protein n=1 Tax=Acidiphilium sp. TaxID=527 RepID=UPI003CFE75BB
KSIGKIGADNIIFRATQVSQIYGVSTIGVNVVNADGTKAPTHEPLPLDDIHNVDLYFNIFDPLNTAGSLVLNQDPLAVDFMHPEQVSVSGQVWSNTKTIVLMHEQPVFIEWTNSAFGFVGRSVYQRAFYDLKSFAISMIADQKVQEKLALLVYKAKSPGSVIDNAGRAFKQMFRTSIKGATNKNVVSIGTEEDLASLNFEHVQQAGEYSRGNILKNIAVASGRPAAFLTQQKLAEGFGEGSEDAKQIAHFVDALRIEMEPLYGFMDNIVMRRAWSPAFYKSMQRKYPERYGKLKYNAALHEWMDAFTPSWPNLLTEPDSEKAKTNQLKLEPAAKIAEIIMSAADPETKAAVCVWLADLVNDQKEFYSSQLIIDPDAIASYEPPAPAPENAEKDA